MLEVLGLVAGRSESFGVGLYVFTSHGTATVEVGISVFMCVP